jgi:hypothetical protein
MTLFDLFFLVLVVGLPTAVSLRLFLNEPPERPFLGTYILAIFGTALLFSLVALILTVSGLGSLGMFDGIFATMAAVPIALVVGLVIRSRRRNQKISLS